MDATATDKRGAFEVMHAAGPVMVHLDPKHTEVAIPTRARRDHAHVNLRFGEGLQPPVHNMRVDEAGLRAVLTFSGVAHTVFVPWGAVFGMTSEARFGAAGTRVWRDSVPEEVFQRMEPLAGKLAPTRKKPRLRMIRGGRA